MYLVLRHHGLDGREYGVDVLVPTCRLYVPKPGTGMVQPLLRVMTGGTSS